MQASRLELVILVSLLLAPLLILGAEGSVSRTFTEACAVWNGRPLPQNQATPGWTNGTLDCALEQPGAMKELVMENVLAQFNLYRTLAGLPNVTRNSTRSTDAQAAAWWDAALIQAGCDPNLLQDCWANNTSTCYSPARETRAQSVRLHNVRWGGTTFSFDVGSILADGNYDVVLNPETTSIGIGMYGNETGVVNQNSTGFSCQTLDAAGAPQLSLNRRETAWYAYPPDGVLEVSAMNGLRMWIFVTNVALASETSVKLFDLQNDFYQHYPEYSSPTSSNGWYWLEFALNPELIVAGAQYEVQIQSNNDTWVYRPSFANCSAPIRCGDGFCQEPTESAASCPEDCQSCGPYPAALEGKPAKCVNGTWLVSGDIMIGEGEGNLQMGTTSSLRFTATGRSTYGSIRATGCSFLDGTLEFAVSFPILGTTPYNFTVVSAPNGTCGIAERQSVGDGTSFRQIKINYQQESECPPTSDSEGSGTSFAILIKPASGCGGGDDTALIAGLTAGLVGGAILFVVLVIAAGLAFAVVKRQRRRKQLAAMQNNLREHAGAV